MTYRFLIALSMLTLLVSVPLAADCWLDCGEEEQAGYAACDPIDDPVLYADCIFWVDSLYIECLDTCEFGFGNPSTPGPWSPVDWNQGRCSVKAPAGLQTSASVSSSLTGASDRSGVSVALPSVRADAQETLASESLPEAIRSKVSAMVRSLQVEALRVPEQEPSDRPAGDTGVPRIAAVENLLEKQTPR